MQNDECTARRHGVLRLCILHLAFCITACITAVAVLAGVRQDPQRPIFHTEANYVRVDVYPTTASGVPVGDLRQDEFEIFDDGAPQKIAQFQHIEIRGNVPQDVRHEPNNVADMRAMMTDPNARVFALFLDLTHVSLTGSHEIRRPLVEMLDRFIGQDDLVGVMTPQMSALDVTFSRRLTSIENFLKKHWDWGDTRTAGSRALNDPVEQMYEMCYPGITEQCIDPQGKPYPVSDVGVADEMIARRREEMVIDSLEDLIRYLGGVREERKAVLLISPGWNLFGPNSKLARPVRCEAPGLPQIGVDPRGGKLTTRPPTGGMPGSRDQCERDRLNLAQLNDLQHFRRLPDEANRANVSFYPIDPGGFHAETTVGDIDRLKDRLDTLRVLADTTDGLAILNTNDLDTGGRRVAADLSSYYLLGYYATNQKPDGKFHAIKVRVNRAGVQVRARRGYLAPTAAEMAAGSAGAPASPAAAAEAGAIADVLAPLSGFTRDLPIRVQLAVGWTLAHAGVIWAVGEIGAGEEVMTAGDADVTLTNALGVTIATAHAHMEPRVRSFRVALAPAGPLAPGEYVVRVRAKRDAAVEPPTNEVVRLTVPLAPDTFGAVLIRRGQVTGNKEVATADLRFRRGEQLRVEVPTESSDAVSARLLDRTGKPLAVPVAAALRDDPDGSRWQTAQLSLTPLGVGDYIIEVTTGAGQAGGAQKRTLIAFRVVP
jgi:VWFA-related protein